MIRYAIQRVAIPSMQNIQKKLDLPKIKSKIYCDALGQKQKVRDTFVYVPYFTMSIRVGYPRAFRLRVMMLFPSESCATRA